MDGSEIRLATWDIQTLKIMSLFIISTRSRRISTVVFCRKKKIPSKNHLKKNWHQLFSPPPKGGSSHHPTPSAETAPARRLTSHGLFRSCAGSCAVVGSPAPGCFPSRFTNLTDRSRRTGASINKQPFRNKTNKKNGKCRKEIFEIMRYIFFLCLGLRMFREETRKTRRKL